MTTKNAQRMMALAMVLVLSTVLGSAVIAQTVVPPTSMIATLTPGRLGGEFEFFGTISSLSGTSVTVNGRVYDISRARLRTSLTVGAQVEIDAAVDSTGAWIAREVEAWNGLHFDEDGETEIFGIVTALSATTITLDGVEFDISQAQLWTSVAVEDFVRVHVARNASDVWVARAVEYWNPLYGDDDDDRRGWDDDDRRGWDDDDDRWDDDDDRWDDDDDRWDDD